MRTDAALRWAQVIRVLAAYQPARYFMGLRLAAVNRDHRSTAAPLVPSVVLPCNLLLCAMCQQVPVGRKF